MNRSFIRAVVALALLLVAISASAKLDARWNDPAPWRCAKVVAVRPFAIRGLVSGVPADDEAMLFFTAELAKRLEKHKGIERVFLASAGATIEPSADVVIDGIVQQRDVVRHDGRLIIGNVVATATVKLTILLQHRGGVSPLVTMDDARTTGLADPDDGTFAALQAIAADVASELLRNRGACEHAEVVANAELPPAPVSAAPVIAASPIAPAPTAPVAQPIASPEPLPAAGIATVTIDSNVPDADVTIDGRFAGNAPIATYRLPAGTHNIAVTAKGWTPWTRDLTVTEGTVTRVAANLEKQ